MKLNTLAIITMLATVALGGACSKEEASTENEGAASTTGLSPSAASMLSVNGWTVTAAAGTVATASELLMQPATNFPPPKDVKSYVKGVHLAVKNAAGGILDSDVLAKPLKLSVTIGGTVAENVAKNYMLLMYSRSLPGDASLTYVMPKATLGFIDVGGTATTIEANIWETEATFILADAPSAPAGYRLYDTSRRGNAKGTWTTANALGGNGDTAFVQSSSVAFAASGNGVVSFLAKGALSDTEQSLWASRYDAATSAWSAAEEVAAAGDITAAQVGMDGSGTAIIVWSVTDGADTKLLVRQAKTGAAWADFQEVATSTSELTDFQLTGVTGTGLIHVAWLESAAAAVSIKYRLLAGTSMSDAGIAMTSTTDAVSAWSFKSDDTGGLAVAWVGRAKAAALAKATVWYASSSAGTWAAGKAAESDQAAYTNLTLLNPGSGVLDVIYERPDAGAQYLLHRRIITTTGVGRATIVATRAISGATFDPMAASACIGPDGSIQVLEGAAKTKTLTSTRRTAAGAWVELFSEVRAGTPSAWQVSCDVYGNAYAVWSEVSADGTQAGIYSRVFAAPIGWDPVKEVASGTRSIAALAMGFDRGGSGGIAALRTVTETDFDAADSAATRAFQVDAFSFGAGK